MRLPPFFLRILPRKPNVPTAVDDDYIAYAFPSEEELEHRAGRPAQLNAPRRGPHLGRGAVAVLVVAAGAVAGVAVFSTASGVEQGSLRVESNPSGALVTIDGRDRGTTPVVVMLPSGRHAATVRAGRRLRTLTVDVEARTTTVHHVELPMDQPAVAGGVTRGTLNIVGDTRARISVDGVARGQAPLSLSDLSPGTHQIVVTTGEAVTRSTVNVAAGTTTSFVVAAPAATANVSGWMTARTRVPLQILEQDRIVGTTEADRILLPVGTHDLEFLNESLGFRATRRVTIAAGRGTDVAVPLPQAPVQLNAIPWAEVWIDGVRVGETPLANVPQTIGPHEVVFKHPQLGERKVKTIVTLSGPSRATADMRVP